MCSNMKMVKRTKERKKMLPVGLLVNNNTGSKIVDICKHSLTGTSQTAFSLVFLG